MLCIGNSVGGVLLYLGASGGTRMFQRLLSDYQKEESSN